MNWIFFLETTLSGILAGYFSWLIVPNTNPWDILNNFHACLLVSGVFCGLFTGLVCSLPVIIKEFRLKKALSFWISATSVGLAIPMVGGVLFSLLVGIISNQAAIPMGVLRFAWWTFLALFLSGAFGFLHGSVKVLCRTVMGLTPSFIVAGILLDKYFLPNQEWLQAFLLLGLCVGIGFVLSWEILKEAWIEEDRGGYVVFRYILESTDFIIGSSDDCDLSIVFGPEHLFCISEKDSLHVLEVLAEDEAVKVNSSCIRYRMLVDGDIIKVGDRTFIYHSKLSRSRDAVPEAFA